MRIFVNRLRNKKNYGVALAVPALLMALLIAVAVTASPTQANVPDDTSGNTGGSNTDDRYPNLSSYDDPQPCGPGAGTAFMEEPHEITAGHYALFDAYWRTIATSTTFFGSETPGPGVGVLHTNECPPEMVATTTSDGFETVTTTIRSAREGGMDIEEAIIHVLDTHLATTVATNAEVTDGQLSLEEYPYVEEYAPAGSQVWWLRLDDRRTTGTPGRDLRSGHGLLHPPAGRGSLAHER